MYQELLQLLWECKKILDFLNVTFQKTTDWNVEPNCFEASTAFFDSWICNDFINDLTLTNKTRINLWLYHGHLQYLPQTLCYGTQQKLINSVWKPNQLDVRGWVRNRFVKCIFITSKNGFIIDRLYSEVVFVDEVVGLLMLFWHTYVF